MSFHYTMMQKLDETQKSGRWVESRHRPMRQALRKASMKGAQITSPEQLAEAIVAGRY